MDVSTAIKYKRAVREFSSQPLSKAEMLVILNAGRRSQSSKNTQPWHFIAITDKTTLQQLSKTGAYASHLAGAVMAVAILHRDPGEKFQVMFDIGQTAAYMQLAAWELGIGSCLASIYEPDQARQILGFPPELTIRIAISFGIPADVDMLSRQPKKGGRRALSETVHWNTW